MNIKRAIFPGSFDPIHEGHIDIIKRAAKLFDELYVAVSINTDKPKQSSLSERYKKVQKIINKFKFKNVFVVCNNKLTIEFAKQLKCNYIVRSIRNYKDYINELNIAKVHHMLNSSIIETILFISTKELAKKSSTNIKRIQVKLNKINK